MKIDVYLTRALCKTYKDYESWQYTTKASLFTDEHVAQKSATVKNADS